MDWGRSLVTAVAVWTTVVACAAGADEPGVSRVESAGVVPRPGELGAMDARLVGLRTGRSDEADDVVVSHDHGRTARAAELPGRPAALELAAGPTGCTSATGWPRWSAATPSRRRPSFPSPSRSSSCGRRPTATSGRRTSSTPRVASWVRRPSRLQAPSRRVAGDLLIIPESGDDGLVAVTTIR